MLISGYCLPPITHKAQNFVPKLIILSNNLLSTLVCDTIMAFPLTETNVRPENSDDLYLRVLSDAEFGLNENGDSEINPSQVQPGSPPPLHPRNKSATSHHLAKKRSRDKGSLAPSIQPRENDGRPPPPIPRRARKSDNHQPPKQLADKDEHQSPIQRQKASFVANHLPSKDRKNSLESVTSRQCLYKKQSSSNKDVVNSSGKQVHQEVQLPVIEQAHSENCNIIRKLLAFLFTGIIRYVRTSYNVMSTHYWY
jgi:hypothetical protein